MKKKSTKIQKIFEEFGFKRKDIESLYQKIPHLNFFIESELEETLITLESLCFKNFQQTILSLPNILLLSSYEIGEDAQQFLWKYREMEMVRRKFLEKRS